jgi:hypothetical protein
MLEPRLADMDIRLPPPVRGGANIEHAHMLDCARLQAFQSVRTRTLRSHEHVCTTKRCGCVGSADD